MKDKETEKELLEFLNNNVCFHLYRLFRPMVSIYDLSLTREYESELKFSHFGVLIVVYYFLYYKGFPPSVFNLMDFMGYERTSLVRELLRQCKEGLVTDKDGVKRNKGKMRKIKVYSLTEQGKKFVEEFLPILNKINNRLLKKFNVDDKNRGAVRMNDKLIEKIKKDYLIVLNEIKDVRDKIKREGRML